MKIDKDLNELENVFRLIDATKPELIRDCMLEEPKTISGENLSNLDKDTINLSANIFKNTSVVVKPNSRGVIIYNGKQTFSYRRIDIEKQWELAGGRSYENASLDAALIKKHVERYLPKLINSVIITLDENKENITVKARDNSLLCIGTFKIEIKTIDTSSASTLGDVQWRDENPV